MRQIYNWIAKAIFLMVIMTSVTHADEIKFKKITLAPGDKVWLLSAEINLELSPALEQLVKKGVTLHFVTEFQLTKGRWYWFDEKIVDVQRTSKISYQALTDQYKVTLGSVTITAANLKQAMGAVSSIDDWAVIEQPMVSPNQTYVAAIRMKLDTNQLAKPFQVNAINSKAWNLQSEWSKFDFTPKMAASIHGAISQ
jgi:hypothetical protein